METLFAFTAPPGHCGYLPGQVWQLEYHAVAELSADEYFERMLRGWRRFGHTMFRPRCPHCAACRSLRVAADRFRPNRSQRRVRKANEGAVELVVGRPAVTRAKLELYDRFHAFQAGFKGWPEHAPKDVGDYAESFVNNPFPVEEWCYYSAGRLVGVGYVDVLPAGLSAIYFYYDPDDRDRSPGTWNVLNVIEQAARRGLPHAYLGYFVEGCRSLEYKANFGPNEVLTPSGTWEPFRGWE